MIADSGRIRVEGQVSREIIENFPKIQAAYHSWNPDFHPVKLEGAVPTEISAVPRNNRTGIYFSAGVDSFYTFLTHREEITDLVFIHGAENKLEKAAYRQRLATVVQETADHYGVNLIQIETNIRDFLDRYVQYGHWGYPITLGAAGLLLAPRIRELHISVEYFPGVHISGSEILPLWDTPVTSLTLSDFFTTRLEKVAYLADNDFVLSHLHVCHGTPENALNCGRCEKCIRTMLNLEVHGALERCPTFATRLTPTLIRRQRLVGQSDREYYRMNLSALEKIGGRKELIAAIKSALRRPDWLNKGERQLRRLRNRFFRRKSIRTS